MLRCSVPEQWRVRNEPGGGQHGAYDNRGGSRKGYPAPPNAGIVREPDIVGQHTIRTCAPASRPGRWRAVPLCGLSVLTPAPCALQTGNVRRCFTPTPHNSGRYTRPSRRSHQTPVSREEIEPLGEHAEHDLAPAQHGGHAPNSTCLHRLAHSEPVSHWRDHGRCQGQYGSSGEDNSRTANTSRSRRSTKTTRAAMWRWGRAQDRSTTNAGPCTPGARSGAGHGFVAQRQRRVAAPLVIARKHPLEGDRRVGGRDHDERRSRSSRTQRTTSSVATGGSRARSESMRAAVSRCSEAPGHMRIAVLTARLQVPEAVAP